MRYIDLFDNSKDFVKGLSLVEASEYNCVYSSDKDEIQDINEKYIQRHDVLCASLLNKRDDLLLKISQIINSKNPTIVLLICDDDMLSKAVNNLQVLSYYISWYRRDDLGKTILIDSKKKTFAIDTIQDNTSGLITLITSIGEEITKQFFN